MRLRLDLRLPAVPTGYTTVWRWFPGVPRWWSRDLVAVTVPHGPPLMLGDAGLAPGEGDHPSSACAHRSDLGAVILNRGCPW